MLPYWYTLFREASVSGLPPMRPLFFADPSDPALRAADDAFLLGPDVMVRCVVTAEGVCNAAMPNGVWHRFELIEIDDPELPELWIRGGSIVPIGPSMQHEGERPTDPLTLLIALDEKGHATGTLYEDAGEGYAYRDGVCLVSRYVAAREAGVVRVTCETIEGQMARPTRGVVVRVIGEAQEWSATGVDGETIEVQIDRRT